jgi:hypothetical protein
VISCGTGSGGRGGDSSPTPGSLVRLWRWLPRPRAGRWMGSALITAGGALAVAPASEAASSVGACKAARKVRRSFGASRCPC